MSVQTDQRPEIDLASAASFADGHPWHQYAWLRQNVPVYWHDEDDGPGFWAVTRYDDVRRISRQPKLFSSYARGVMMPESDELALAAQRQMMLTMDPPQHDRFKLLVSRGFTPKNAQLLRHRIQERMQPAHLRVEDLGKLCRRLVLDVAILDHTCCVIRPRTGPCAGRTSSSRAATAAPSRTSTER